MEILAAYFLKFQAERWSTERSGSARVRGPCSRAYAGNGSQFLVTIDGRPCRYRQLPE